MAVASKVVSKRSARTFMDEGMEKDAPDSYNPRKTTLEHHNSRKPAPESHNPRKIPSKFGEAREVEADSSSSRSSLASHSDSDISPSISDRTEPCPIPAGFTTAKPPHRESVHSLAALVSSKLTGLEKSLSFPKDPGSSPMELSAGTYPVNFGIVVPGVYRSSYPEPQDYDALKGLGLKTIITLVQKDLPTGYNTFITSNKIRHHVFNMEGTKKAEIPIKTMKSILRLVLDQQAHPLLIHCNHGRHRTGCVVAVVRKLTGWEQSRIVREYKSYAEPKVRECDIKYITEFDLATISNLFVKESGWNRNFVHLAIFTTVVLLLWLFSGTKIASQTTST